MRTVSFAKLEGAGNDFILIDATQVPLNDRILSLYAQKLCTRRFGIGADGLLVIDETDKGTVMRIFNADGSEAEMCGNGARCAAFWIFAAQGRKAGIISFMTGAGPVSAEVEEEGEFRAQVRIKMTVPFDVRRDLDVPTEKGTFTAHFINTGVPHTVLFVEDVDAADVSGLGREIRYQPMFAPAGTNVDFVQREGEGLKVRTYERGVEAETLACGTGTVASAIISELTEEPGTIKRGPHKKTVRVRSGDEMEVSFTAGEQGVTDVWLKGKVTFVCRGEVPREFIEGGKK